jgi:hypothetical protein
MAAANDKITFMNPAAVVYTILCFSEAIGCDVRGIPTDEYTWFPGYTWAYALCGGCEIHLGWCFEGSAGSFFGLIHDRVTSVA